MHLKIHSAPGSYDRTSDGEAVSAARDHPVYRPDIDGLRAIAVLAVIGFHAAPGRIPSGFIGVDIFFVISGFLISTIIVNGLNKNQFSFLEFYSRRIKRIFPALLVVLLASFVVGALVLTDDEFRSFGKHMAAGAAFISNFALWAESGYFDSTADFKPLLHLWSLGIEEQFYIVWPLLLWSIAKRNSGFAALTITVAVVSFALNVYQTSASPIAAFYSPLSRFWELLLGCGLALLMEKAFLSNAAHRNAVSILGLALLVVSFLYIDRNRAFPGWWALLPSIAAALLILAGPRVWFNRIFLSNPVLVWIGLISFPLYLWHWPALSFLRILEGAEIGQSKRLAAIFVSIGLAWLTYELIEKPIRQHSRMPGPMVLTVAMCLTCGIGLTFSRADASGWRPLKPVIVNAGEIGPDIFLNAVHSKFFPCTPVEIRRASDSWNGIVRCYQSMRKDQKDIAIIGDSHAEHLFPGLAERLNNRNIAFYGMDGLPFLSNPDYAHIYDYVLADRNISEVVIAAVWDRTLGQSPISDWRDDMARTVTRLTSAGKRVYLVDDVPHFSFQPNRCKYADRFGIENKCFEKDTGIAAIYVPIFREIAAADSAVRFLSIRDAFCTGGVCSMSDNGTLLFRDQHHLTLSGSMKAADAMLNQMWIR